MKEVLQEDFNFVNSFLNKFDWNWVYTTLARLDFSEKMKIIHLNDAIASLRWISLFRILLFCRNGKHSISSVNKVVLDCESNSFQARVYLEFLKDMLNVIPHRTWADGKESSDIPGAMALRQER